jgi:NRPS condensation-like uncharacterized protein
MHRAFMLTLVILILLILQTVSSNDSLYIHGFTFKLKPGCSLEKLKSAWQQVIHDTSILRTSFVFTEGLSRWAQVTHTVFELPWISMQYEDPSNALSEFISSFSFADVGDFKQPPCTSVTVTSTTMTIFWLFYIMLYMTVSPCPYSLTGFDRFITELPCHHQFRSTSWCPKS